MEKKRVITNYEKLSPDVIDLVDKKYPDGFLNHVMKIEKPTGGSFYAFTVDSDTTSYLVKVNVPVDGGIDDLDESFFNKKNSYEGESEALDEDVSEDDSDF